MVKKMPESALEQKTQLNKQTHIKSGNIEKILLDSQQDNQQALSASEPKQFNNPTQANCQQAKGIQNVPQHSFKSNKIQKPSYRITSYPIENKTYRLISFGEQDSSDDDSINQRDNMDINLQEDEFRQEPFLPPRFNPFSRWNNRNQARRISNRRSMRGKKTTIQSIVSTVRKLYMYMKTARLSSLCEYIPFYPHPPTLYSKYSNISLTILSNSINLQLAVIKAMEYNIPLMQIIMNPKHAGEQKIVVEKILRDFTIAHFINQNFVLYGDWACFEAYRQVFVNNSIRNGEDMRNDLRDKMSDRHESLFDYGGKIVFRKGEVVFAEIDLSYVGMIDHKQFQEKLQQIRNHFYRQKQLYRNPHSGISSTISQSISQKDSARSNGPAQPKRVEQIEQQILKDYLQQKIKQQMQQKIRDQILWEEHIYDDDGDDDKDDGEFYDQQEGEVVYAEDGSSFLKSQIQQLNEKVRIGQERQQKKQNRNKYSKQVNDGDDMLQSRKKETAS